MQSVQQYNIFSSSAQPLKLPIYQSFCIVPTTIIILSQKILVNTSYKNVVWPQHAQTNI